MLARLFNSKAQDEHMQDKGEASPVDQQCGYISYHPFSGVGDSQAGTDLVANLLLARKIGFPAEPAAAFCVLKAHATGAVRHRTDERRMPMTRKLWPRVEHEVVQQYVLNLDLS